MFDEASSPVHFEGCRRLIDAVARPISFRLSVAELRQLYNDTKSDSTPILSSIIKKY